MLNKEEKQILLNYPLLQSIDVYDYLADFVMNNLDNYPVSSSVLSYLKSFEINKSLVNSINRFTIKNELLPKFVSDSYGYSRIENCMNFTSALIIFASRSYEKNNSSFTILNKTKDDITIILRNKDYSKYFIFNTNLDSDLYIINKNDESLFMNEFTRNSTNLIEKGNFPCDYYNLPINPIYKNSNDEKEKYFDRFELFMRYITGNSKRLLESNNSNNPYCNSNTAISLSSIPYYFDNDDIVIDNFFKKCLVPKKTNKEIEIKFAETFPVKSVANKVILTSNYF